MTGGARPLDGLRVLDFGWVAVGPVIGSLLAEMGAEVIKIESSRRLDYCRLLPPTPAGRREQPDGTPVAADLDMVSMFHN